MADKLQAFLIYGGESSGCRWLTRLFLSAGCHGDGDHYQRINEPDFRANLLGNQNTPVVWRHSVPEAHEWPDPQLHVQEFVRYGYNVKAFVIVRDWWPMSHSQVPRQHVSTLDDAISNLRRAYATTLNSLFANNVDFHMVTYEAFLLHPQQAIGSIMSIADLQAPTEYESPTDENAKWYV